MKKSDKGGWKVDEAAPAVAPSIEAPAFLEIGKPPRGRIWPFGKRPDAPTS